MSRRQDIRGVCFGQITPQDGTTVPDAKKNLGVFCVLCGKKCPAFVPFVCFVANKQKRCALCASAVQKNVRIGGSHQELTVQERPELEAARLAREAQTARRATPSVEGVVAVRDPLPYCIYATVALLAWVASPPVVVAAFAALGFHRYWRAYRAGLRKSDCVLGDPRRVMAYLGALAGAGVSVSLWRLVQWLL
jgi:hypothetical protein